MTTEKDLAGDPDPKAGSEAAEGESHPATRGPRSERLRRPRVVVAGIAVIALIAGGVAWLLTRSSGSSAAATTTEQLVAVTRGSIGSAVTAEGTIAAAQTDDLNFGSSGQVTAVNVKAGDKVTKGQVLATINSASLASSLSSAQANLATAQAKLSDDQTAGASTDQINADQTSVQSATDSVTNAQQALAGASLVATFDGTVSQVNISVGEQLTSSGTGGTSQTGTGTGSGQSASSLGAGGGNGGTGGNGSGSGSSSSSSSPAIQVISQGQYSVTLSVGTSDVSRVAVGQPATLTVTTSSASGDRGGRFAQLFGAGGLRAALDGGGSNGNSTNGNSSSAATGSSPGPSATGSVTSVSAVASASSGVATYPVVVTFNADSTSFYPGATVTGSITTQAKNNVIEVPTRAISTQKGKSVVTVSTNGQAGGPTETRTVTTGITAGGFTEITSGLKVGEHVVITLPSIFGGGGTRTFGGGGNGGFGGNGTSTGGGAAPAKGAGG